jgi:hypothetical protein
VRVEMRVVHRQGTERTESWRVGAGDRGRRFDRRLEVLRNSHRREVSEPAPPTHSRTFGGSTHSLLPLSVDLFERVLPRPFCLEPLVVLVKLQGGPGVLDRVVRVGLDARVQDSVGEEAQRELALALRQVVDVDRVDDLRGRDVDVCE